MAHVVLGPISRAIAMATAQQLRDQDWEFMVKDLVVGRAILTQPGAAAEVEVHLALRQRIAWVVREGLIFKAASQDK